MSTAPVLPWEAAALHEQSVEWRLFSLLFEYPTSQWRDSLTALLGSLSRPDLRTIAEAALRQSSPGLITVLFGPAGSVPVGAARYQGGLQFGYLTSELAAYYDAFGYPPQVEAAPDHLAVQLGLLAYLRLKQAHALAQDDPERTRIAADAADEFLPQHIAAQAEPVLQGLETSGTDYLIDAVQLILAHVGRAPRTGFAFGDQERDSDETMSCGPSAASADFIQIQPK